MSYEDLLEYRQAIRENPLRMEQIMDEIMKKQGKHIVCSLDLSKFRLSASNEVHGKKEDSGSTA